MARSNQSITWLKNSKFITSGLVRVGAIRQPYLGPRDSPKRWPNITRNMAQNSKQWGSQIRNISFSVYLLNFPFYSQSFISLVSFLPSSVDALEKQKPNQSTLAQGSLCAH